MRELAADPNSFIPRQGWKTLEFGNANEIAALRALLDTLSAAVGAEIEALNNLRESDGIELYRRSHERPWPLEEVAAEQIDTINREIVELQIKAEKLNAEMAELTEGIEPTIA